MNFTLPLSLTNTKNKLKIRKKLKSFDELKDPHPLMLRAEAAEGGNLGLRLA